MKGQWHMQVAQHKFVWNREREILLNRLHGGVSGGGGRRSGGAVLLCGTLHPRPPPTPPPTPLGLSKWKFLHEFLRVLVLQRAMPTSAMPMT